MRVRPYAAAAILRGVKFTKRKYQSFISLQDKLHSNLARNRTLVAIGTHDLSTIKGPFTYEALKPEDIKFAPLNQTKVMNGKELMEFYEHDKHLGKFLHIIRDSPVYPVIYDSQRRVLSLPPIINGDLSKISLNTSDIFIDCTATDKTKLEIVINMMVAMFSMHTAKPFT
jgi:phenylalanyl-tRNA synthetase beta chain